MDLCVGGFFWWSVWLSLQDCFFREDGAVCYMLEGHLSETQEY